MAMGTEVVDFLENVVPPSSPEILERLPVRVVGAQEARTCEVCLDEIQVGEEVPRGSLEVFRAVARPCKVFTTRQF